MRQLKITKSITNRETASLDKYLQEIGREGLITADEEVKLAQQIKAGSQEALEKLTKANLRFCHFPLQRAPGTGPRVAGTSWPTSATMWYSPRAAHGWSLRTIAHAFDVHHHNVKRALECACMALADSCPEGSCATSPLCRRVFYVSKAAMRHGRACDRSHEARAVGGRT